MTTNVYLMPSVVTTDPDHPGRTVVQAKYVADLGAATFSQLIYGDEGSALVAVQDVPAAVHLALAVHTDVTVVPDLAQNVGAQLTAVQNALEGLNLPAQWVTSGMSYGSVVRVVAVFFLLIERYQGLGGTHFLTGTVTLDTRWNQLPTAVRNSLLATAQSFNFDTSSLSGSSTLRAILKALADQWGNLSIYVNGVVL